MMALQPVRHAPIPLPPSGSWLARVAPTRRASTHGRCRSAAHPSSRNYLQSLPGCPVCRAIGAASPPTAVSRLCALRRGVERSMACLEGSRLSRNGSITGGVPPCQAKSHRRWASGYRSPLLRPRKRRIDEQSRRPFVPPAFAVMALRTVVAVWWRPTRRPWWRGSVPEIGARARIHRHPGKLMTTWHGEIPCYPPRSLLSFAQGQIRTILS